MQTKSEWQKRKITLMDKIIRKIGTSVASVKLVVSEIKHDGLNKSNISRTLKRLQEIGVLEKQGRGEYILSEGLKEILRRKGVDIEKDNQVNLLTLYESINEVFSQCTGLTEEEIKFHMAVEGLISFIKNSNVDIEKYLNDKYEKKDKYNKFIKRTAIMIKSHYYGQDNQEILSGATTKQVAYLGLITVRRKEDDFGEALTYLLNVLEF